MMRQPPFYSVIVPAHNAAGFLPQSLGALLASDFPRQRWELIVVDDGSSDETAEVAARYADSIVRLPGRAHGPAYARNRGAEVSRGDVIVFFDADVVVHRDTLRRFAEVLDADESIGAAFGAYDTNPPAPGLMSQYRNLLHHFVHTQNGGDVETFWAGAGAIRHTLFTTVGMYDEWHFPRPQIEDIELGSRISRGGGRIVLHPEIQVTHLKRWTLSGVVRTDVLDRGIPWARLLAHRGAMISTGTLNLRWTEKAATALVWIAALCAAAALLLQLPTLLFGSAVSVVLVLALTAPLWRFFARTRGWIFALRVIPAHLLYYLLNGISFAIGLSLQHLVGAPLPDPTTEAFAEVGVKRWPPVPSRDRPSSWNADKP